MVTHRDPAPRVTHLMDMPTRSAERVARADGRVYVARKRPEFIPVRLGDGVVLLVLRTHDVEGLRVGAERAWEVYGFGPLPAGQQVWVRKVPWSPTGDSGFSYQQVESVSRGAVPALWFERSRRLREDR